MSLHAFPRTRPPALAAACAAAVLFLLTLPASHAPAQARAVPGMGTAGILHEILKLRTTASVLVVGAHPDDEDSFFIARLARGDHARVGYLSLTRGEGGQNAIGPELFEALGVIRTEELLQARTLDGGEQFFGREIDFGFSKTLEESARMWGEQEVLRDMVRVIRLFRPLVIYSIFSGTPADGHGHHQLSGRLVPVAFHAAGDPGRFPEQIAEGLRPWQAMKLYRGTGFGGGIASTAGAGGATVRVPEGLVDPLLGMTYAQIGAEGRSLHRTQSMGTAEVRGRAASGLVLVDSTIPAASSEKNIFDGIDTSLPGIAAVTGLPAGGLKQELAAADQAVGRALDAYSVLAPERSVPALASALSAIRDARRAVQGLAGASAAAKADADDILAAKERGAVLALQGAAGIAVDAVADTETAAGGESFTASVRVFLSHPDLVTVTGVTMDAPQGWVAQRVSAAPGPGAVQEEADSTDTFSLTVPPDAVPTQPYWLIAPREGNLYGWPDGSPRAQPFAPPLAAGVVRVRVGGVEITLRQPLQYRVIDPTRGELRRNVEVVPALTVSFDAQTELVPLETRGAARRVTVVVQNNSTAHQEGILALSLPQGWTASPAQPPFSLDRKGDRATLAVMVTPARSAAPAQYSLKAAAVVKGASFDQSLRTIAYSHIQTHRIYEQTRTTFSVLDLKVAPVRVGYIMGSGDKVPDALRRMGLEVTLLDEATLTTGTLDSFDTIVVGINASTARPEFAAALPRLYDFARRGGALVVQYQHPEYVRRNLAPFPAEMASRVTDETAAVKVLAPSHPLFTTPNRIGAADFDGWVQERNLYAFTTFDPRYTALLESHDPGEPPQRGGEVYAALGKGHYVYTSYAWFRQLPAGVPGAYRLFANLVSLGARQK
jgi:LmbE family N-acetylglucosaminyl deacetylase